MNLIPGNLYKIHKIGINRSYSSIALWKAPIERMSEAILNDILRLLTVNEYFIFLKLQKKSMQVIDSKGKIGYIFDSITIYLKEINDNKQETIFEWYGPI